MKNLVLYMARRQLVLGIGAAAMAAQSEIELGQFSGFTHLHLLLFSAAMLAYNTAELRHMFRPETPFRKRILPALLMLGAFTGLIQSNSALIVLFVPLALLSWFYSRPLLLQGRLRSLRQIPYLKIFLIAFCWASMSVCLPLAAHSAPLNAQALQVFALRFLFLLAITLPFDLRDLAQDKRAGIKTLAHVTGAKNIQLLAAFLLIAMTALAAYVHGLDSLLFMAYLISALYCLVLILSSAAFKIRQRYYLLLDAGIVLQGVAVLLPALLQGFV